MPKENWDFKGENTKEYTHGFHTYPAMMIPQIARKLIEMYGKDAKILLDPFCGSGTSLVEARLTPHVKKIYGFDLNPLTIYITDVKITPLDCNLLWDCLYDILNKVRSNPEKLRNYDLPKFKNISFWFKEEVIDNLTKLKIEIDKIKRSDIKNFFLIIFSETVRNVSNTRNSEFKLYRMPKKKLENFFPDTYRVFEEYAIRNTQNMEEYLKRLKELNRLGKNSPHTHLQLLDTKNDLPIKDETVDIIVTSPPYGDSKTTVAYGQFSRLALQWFGFNEINNLDNKLLGGVASKELNIKINSSTLKDIIEKIAKEDEKRAREVLSFYEDFDKCIIQLNRVLAKNGFVCFVVGNRTVKGIQIPTDKIMIEMFMAHGDYEHIATHKRTIPNKRMPKINSPTNVKGKTSTTMTNEYIFILQKKS